MKKIIIENLMSVGYLMIAIAMLTFFINSATTSSVCFSQRNCGKACSAAGSSRCTQCDKYAESQPGAVAIHSDGQGRASAAYCGQGKTGKPNSTGGCSCPNSAGNCGGLSVTNDSCIHDS